MILAQPSVQPFDPFAPGSAAVAVLVFLRLTGLVLIAPVFSAPRLTNVTSGRSGTTAFFSSPTSSTASFRNATALPSSARAAMGRSSPTWSSVSVLLS